MQKHDYPVWLLAALAHAGVKEKTHGHSGAIQLFFALSGHPQIKSDEVAWCAAFVGACLVRSGLKGSGSLMARSYMSYGKPCELKPGAIVVFPRGKDPAFGHVGFVLRFDAKSVWIINGNVGDQVTTSKRAISSILPGGIRWPDGEPAAMPRFENALAFVAGGPDFDPERSETWGVEGAFSDDPADPGGATMAGVTIGRLRQWRGKPVSKADVRELQFPEIRAIYLAHYWFEGFCDLLPSPLDLAHFDCTVNQGRGRSAPFLQKAIGVPDDGDIGPITLAKAERSDRSVIGKYMDIRAAHYRSLPHFWRFGRGWLNRLEKLRAACDITPSKTAPKQEAKPMAETPANVPTLPEPPKWWLHSKTVWGALIASASFYLPIVATIAGYPITSADIQLVGELGTNVITAIGQVIGFALVVYGRSAASGPIGSRPVTFRF